MSETLTFRGNLKGHSNWVTAIATSLENDQMVISASRGA
jgi:guanine nucleotide-binding protein subunit beta-2-like 1 protein